MWRIAPATILLGGWLAVGGLWAQTGTEDAVAVVLTVRDNAIATMDLTYARTLTPAELSADLRQVERWTGWTLGAPRQGGQSQGTACQVTVEAGGIIEASLADTMWALVAALAGHGRIGLAVIGAPVTAAPLTIENRFVRMEQSGGQGVQSYQVQIKDRNFATLDELRRPEQTRPQAGGGQRRGLGWAWVLLILGASLAAVAMYYLTRWATAPPSGGRHGRRAG